MGKFCCVQNCKNYNDGEVRESQVSFFSFPVKNESLMQKWKDVIPSKGIIGKYTYICSRHFSESDFTNFTGAKKRCLKKDAVPSIFKCHVMSNTTPQITVREADVAENTQVIATQVPSKNNSIEEKNRALQRQIKVTQQRLRRRELKLSNVAELIKSLTRKKGSSDALEEVLFREFSGFNLELFQNERRNEQSPKNHRRHSSKIIKFASTLYSYSPKAYRFVRNSLSLPHVSTLRSLRLLKDHEKKDF